MIDACMASILPITGRAVTVHAVILTLALVLPVAAASAAPVTVHSTDAQVVIVVDGKPVGSTPIANLDLAAGEHEIGVRSTLYGATAFTERISVPESGTVDLFVDWGKQAIWIATAPPPRPPAAPASPPAPPPAAAAPPPTPTGDLYVASEPSGAEVFLDGASTGMKTPALLSAIAAGQHKLEARTECARATADGQVRPGVVNRAQLTLVEGKASVTVTTNPVGANVFVDGTTAGAAPAKLALGCGEHRIEARAAGYLSRSTTVDALAYETLPVDLVLDKETFGALSIKPTPLTAEVEVDGVVAGTGAMTIGKIATGTHSVTLRADGYRTETRSIDVVADATGELQVTLKPKSSPGKIARIALNSAATASGLGLGVAALVSYAEGADAYERFLDEESDDEAADIFDDEVKPAQTAAIVEGVLAGVLLAGAGALWITTDLALTPTLGGAVLTARW